MTAHKKKSATGDANVDTNVFFTPKQLAARWQCSLMKLRRMRRIGTIGVTYIGRSARYRRDDVLRVEADAEA